VFTYAPSIHNYQDGFVCLTHTAKVIIVGLLNG